MCVQAEHGLRPLHCMHAIKTALDPFNIMNPGKLGSHPSTFITRIDVPQPGPE